MDAILKNLKNAWLSPSGQVVFRHPQLNQANAWHEELASLILADKFDVKFPDNSTETLEKKNWIRLHGFGGRRPIWLCDPDKITRKQTQTIQDWCILNEKHFDEVFD